MEINIQEILEKHCAPCIYNDSPLSKEVKKAIKDIIIAVLQEAADSAEAIEGWNTGFSGNAASVDKESITSTINKVKF